jgi:hypothetical protein
MPAAWLLAEPLREIVSVHVSIALGGEGAQHFRR